MRSLEAVGVAGADNDMTVISVCKAEDVAPTGVMGSEAETKRLTARGEVWVEWYKSSWGTS